jgi:hypothetical protein
LTGTDNRVAFYAHFYLWRAEQLAGNAGGAAIELQEASHYVKFVDRDSAESKMLRQEMAARPQQGSSFAARLRRRGLDRDQARKPRRSRRSDGARKL